MKFFQNSHNIAEKLYTYDTNQYCYEYILANITSKYISSICIPKLSASILDVFKEGYSLIDENTFQRELWMDSKGINIASESAYFKDNAIYQVKKSDDAFVLNVFYPTDSRPNLDFVSKFILDTKSRVSVMIKTMGGLETQSVKIDPLAIDDLALNYGEGFPDIHNNITTKLKDSRSGIMFFHGDPGTGKSSYIKYLTSIIDKEFIFIPIAYAGELGSPELIPLLLEHKDSILILEDAEKVVQSREQDDGNVSTVSTLLNISDGILGSMLNIKIIATYNGKKDKVDQALLRPGRLSMDYTFRKLTAIEANKLAVKLGKPANFTKDQSLADIYNLGDINNAPIKQEVKRIGFV